MADYSKNFKTSMMGHLDFKEGDPEDGYVAPKGYKPSTAIERNNWNQFLDYLGKNGVGGSTNLDARDKSLGLKYLHQYNEENPNSAIPEAFIPTAQYESYLIRRKNEFPGLTPTQSQYAFQNLSPQYRNRPISAVDNWLGSYTSKQYYPTFERLSKEGKTQFGTSFENYVSGLDENTMKNSLVRASK